MTISLQANAAGNAGQINIGATPVANLTQVAGIPFCKNKLFNGEVTRINQRGFDGNWAAKAGYPAGTIAQNEAAYGYDMWAQHISKTYMIQFIEAGNFRPSTLHTLSGIGVTTQQITSPASGNWEIPAPFGATNIQVEEGAVATPFEIRPISFELAQCQRYYEVLRTGISFIAGGAAATVNSYMTFVTKRVLPSVVAGASTVTSNANAKSTTIRTASTLIQNATSAAAGNVQIENDVYLSAVI